MRIGTPIKQPACLKQRYIIGGQYSLLPSINNDGNVVFASYADLDPAVSPNNKTQIFLYTPPDTTAPTSTITPGTGATTTTGEVTITATDDSKDVPTIYYRIDSETTQTVTTGKATFIIDSEGTHTITYYAQDSSGNSDGPHTATITVDKTAPVTTATHPTGTYAVGHKLELTATDNLSGVDWTRFSVNGGEVVSYAGAYTFSLPGTYEVTFYSQDKAGNREAAKTVTYTIKGDDPAPAPDTTPPTITEPKADATSATPPSSSATKATPTKLNVGTGDSTGLWLVVAALVTAAGLVLVGTRKKSRG